MKRTRVLRLVLLGGGVVVMVAGCGDQGPPRNDQTLRFACEQARQQNLPNANEICQRATTSTSSSSGSSGYTSGSGSRAPGTWFPWFFGRSYAGNDRGSGSSWFSGRSSSSSAFTGSSSGSSSSRGGFGSTSSSAGS
jgi:hypothetical protein